MAEFKDLKIKAELVAQLSKLRISTPTQIQEEAIPIILKKRNLIAKAQTSTKTSAQERSDTLDEMTREAVEAGMYEDTTEDS